MRSRQMSDKLYIVIPAYNEEENIESVAREWHEVAAKCGNGSRLLIVDDGSKDSTYKKLLDLSEELELLEPVTKPNGGHGASVLWGYNYALAQGADYIFQTDSDGQTLPKEFYPMWEQRKTCDAIIGQRIGRQDGKSRVFVSKVLKFVLLLVYRVNIPDANTPFRLISRETMERYISYIPKDFNLSNVMLSVLMMSGQKKVEATVKFMPITFRPRQGGTNSINMKKIFKIGAKAVGDFITIKRLLP